MATGLVLPIRLVRTSLTGLTRCGLKHQKQLLRHCGSHSNSQVRVRFAPSPTGQLHLGGLRTALYNYLFAKSHGGKFLLRIEDTDQTRLVPGAMDKLIDILQWSGFDIDEGPGKGGEHGPYIQSKRINNYWQHIQPLLQNGSAYHCFCTPRRLEILRKEAMRSGETPKYDNRCRHMTFNEIEAKLKNNEPYVIRFKLEAHPESWEDMIYGPITHDVAEIEGDPILLKSDRNPTYHFANIVDDHLMEISHVLRGVEWQASTTKHILLYKALGWRPPKFAHLPLLLNRDGTKLSKRQNDIHVEYFKDMGFLPEAVLNILTVAGSGFKADTLGMDLPTLIDNFDLSLLRTNSSRLDLERTSAINRVYLQKKIRGSGRQNVIEDTKKLIDERLSSKYPNNQDLQVLKDDSFLEHILDVCQTRIDTLQDLFENKLSFIWFVPESQDLQSSLALSVDKNTIGIILTETINLVENLPKSDFHDVANLAASLKAIVKSQKIGMKTFMTTLRLALSGLKEGPSVAEIISIIGKENSLRRLELCQATFNSQSSSTLSQQ